MASSSALSLPAPDPKEAQDFFFRRMRFLRLFEESGDGDGDGDERVHQQRPPRQRLAAASKFGKIFAGKKEPMY